jgi:hypothetical protein
MVRHDRRAAIDPLYEQISAAPHEPPLAPG